MGRHVTAGLSDAQRIALSEFFEGHISAGQLSQRLGIESSAQIEGSSQRQSPVTEVHREVLRNRVARGAAGPG